MNGIHRYEHRHKRHAFRRFRVLAIVLMVTGAALVHAHGGDDHGGAEPAPAAAASASELSVHGATAKHELLLKYAAADVNTPVRLRFFLADFPTNRAAADANFVVSSRPAGMKTRGPATMISPGIYEMTATFPADTAYTLVTTLAVPDGQEQIELRNVFAGESARRFLEEHGAHAVDQQANDKATGGWMLPAAIAGAAVLLFAAAMLLRRGRTRTDMAGKKPSAGDAEPVAMRETEEKR